jgi:hypothetical protein
VGTAERLAGEADDVRRDRLLRLPSQELLELVLEPEEDVARVARGREAGVAECSVKALVRLAVAPFSEGLSLRAEAAVELQVLALGAGGPAGRGAIAPPRLPAHARTRLGALTLTRRVLHEAALRPVMLVAGLVRRGGAVRLVAGHGVARLLRVVEAVAEADTGAGAPRVAVHAGRLLDGSEVPVVARALREQEDRLVRLREAVARALRHRVALRPDDVLSQPPAVGLQREGEPPGLADEVLRLQAVDDEVAARNREVVAPAAGRHRALLAPRDRRLVDLVPRVAQGGRPTLAAAAAAGVAVAEVQEAGAVITQHAADLAHDADHGLHPGVDGRFRPDLAVLLRMVRWQVAAEAPVGRRGEHAVDRGVGQGLEHVATVAADDADAHRRAT